MAYNYLVDQAIRTIWCNPGQDYQLPMKLARITTRGGVWNRVKIMWNDYDLPLQGQRFHAFQIGQINPQLIGFFPLSGAWVSLAEASTAMLTVMDLYNDDGVHIPLTQAWYLVTENKDLVVVIRDQATIPVLLDQEDIYLRVYSNAYFAVERAAGGSGRVVVKGGVMGTREEILALQNLYDQYAKQPGVVNAYVNGYLVKAINLITVKVGDAAEIVYDSSVYKTVDFPIKDLLTFESLLDKKLKYLLHYSGSSNQIDYLDDNDIFVYKPNSDGSIKGVMYHRNLADAVRMVTHKDYSIPSEYIVGIVKSQAGWKDPNELVVRLQIRRSGTQHPLVDENNRIKELYKLDDKTIMESFLGLNAVLDQWRAENLEASSYTELMRHQSPNLPIELVESTYGYNAIAKMIGYTPSKTRYESGQWICDLPYGLVNKSSGFEYDGDGLLIGWNTHAYGTHYVASSQFTRLVEVMPGYGTRTLDETYGERVVPLEKNLDYRMYTCPIVDDKPTGQWEDVTGTGAYAVDSNNYLNWLVDTKTTYTMVRSDSTILAYALSLKMLDGILKFSLTTRARRNGTMSDWVMQVPMGSLDVWLNGHALVRGVDYILRFPEIVIINKKFLNDPLHKEQKIFVRAYGHCDSKLRWTDCDADRGFVTYGMLSRNNRYDIRDDKVMHVVVGGALYDKSELKFAEDNPAVSPIDAKNGMPYEVKEMIVPFRGLTKSDTYSLQAASSKIDKKIADYMTLKDPEIKPPNPGTMNEFWPVVSPMACKIIYDLINQALVNDKLKQFYNDGDVREICKPYEYLLKFDPTQDDLLPDQNFVKIHPHNLFNVIDVDIYTFKFVSRVNDLYLNKRLNLSGFLRIVK